MSELLEFESLPRNKNSMLKIPTKQKSLEFVRPISWAEIFASWKKGEANQKSWKKHWESRGFNLWDEWRESYIAPLEPEKREWFLYKITNPLQDIPELYAVPSKAWIEKAYAGKKTLRFKDILHLSVIADNEKISDIRRSFPQKTMLTGVVHGENIILYEGMHRAAAVASWNQEQKFTAQVFIALTELDNKKEIPIVGGDHKIR